MSTDYRTTYAAYLGLTNAGYSGERDAEISEHRAAVLNDMLYSPDYHDDCRRNGVKQGLMLTRGGEENTYNVICRPGDQLYAGDIIDAFGEKWIVMEARADDTTHKTGIMHQCNHYMKWQNFDTTIYGIWCYVRASGYSAYINSDPKLQKSDEQEAIYLPLNEATEKIFVDKRLPSHVEYNRHGERVLAAMKVTGINPISRSYNIDDHLLTLKIEAEIAHEAGVHKDNIDLMVCDFIDGGSTEVVDLTSASDCDDCYWKTISSRTKQSDNGSDDGGDAADVLTIAISGKGRIRISRSGSYEAVVYDSEGNDVTDEHPVEWTVGEAVGVSHEIDANKVKLIASKSAEAGEVIVIAAKYGDISAEIEVEVVGLV